MARKSLAAEIARVLDGALQLPDTGSVGRRAASVLRGTPALSQSMWPEDLTNGVSLSMNTRKRHEVLTGGPIRLVYVNFSGREDNVLPPNTIPVRASIEINGVFYPVFFGGRRLVTFEPGAQVISDPLSVPFVAGQAVFSWTWVQLAAGEKAPLSRNLLYAPWGEGNDATDGVAAVDKTLTGAITPNNQKGYFPTVITSAVVNPATAVVGLLADSIGSGSGDTVPGAAGYGFLRRALNNTVPYVSVATGGGRHSTNTGFAYGPVRTARMAFLAGCTHVIDELGVNDTTADQPLAPLQTAALAVWVELAALGIKVYRTTITPFSASTDVWATAGNQTVGLGLATRIAFNDWIRDGAPLDPVTKAPVATGTVTALRTGQTGHPLAGYFDTADAVESARNSGKWKSPAYTVDGLHPTSTGHVAMATTINPSVFGGSSVGMGGAPGDFPWTLRASTADNSWRSVLWVPQLGTSGLFVAVAQTGADRVMTSPDGFTWTPRTVPLQDYTSLAYSPQLGLLVAVAQGGTAGQRVITSPDGIVWTQRNTPTPSADLVWNGVCWSPERSLFVAVSGSGVGSRVMTSPDGITWTLRTTPANLTFTSICWSPTRLLFVAVARDGAGNRAMTSPDGIVWTSRSTPADNFWNSVVWAGGMGTSGLFVAVAWSGAGNRVMTSPDGITWTTRATPLPDSDWLSVTYAASLGLLVAVAFQGSGKKIMTSFDGITWVADDAPSDNQWRSVTYSPERNLFVAVATTGSGDRVMTSV